jgi:hypothetical protein
MFRYSFSYFVDKVFLRISLKPDLISQNRQLQLNFSFWIFSAFTILIFKKKKNLN